VIDLGQERRALAAMADLPFREFEFHGHVGRRRTVSFGWRYDFATETLERAEEMPEWLRLLREPVAVFAGLEPDALPHVLVTEYGAGAGIGWHRDKRVFGEVVGLSLGAACSFRLRRALAGGAWERATITAVPRSAYLMSGPARTVWEHSIPPVDEPRWSITFRTLARTAPGGRRAR